MPAKNGNVFLKLLVVLALIGGGVAFAVFGFRETALVQEVIVGTSADAVQGSVVVHADKDLQQLRIELGGRVKSLAPHFDPGKSFKKGDVLLELDTTDVERQIADLTRQERTREEEVRIRRSRNEQKMLAEQNLQNVKRLFELREMSAEDVKAAERKLAEVEMQLELEDLASRKAKEDFQHALATLKLVQQRMSVIAPMDGVVHEVFAAPGALLSPGAVVGTFYSNQRVLKASISEEDFAKVKVNQPANVRLLSYSGREFEGAVTDILPIADPETRRYTVYLKVDAPLQYLTPFGTGEATITIDERHNVPIVPRRAIFNGNFVFVVNNGVVERHQIEMGYKSLNRVEVIKGLKAGDLVIVEDLERFRAGQRVRIERVK